MTDAEAFAAGYAAGQRDMRERAAGCCHFDVYNIGPCAELDIRALSLLEPPAPPWSRAPLVEPVRAVSRSEAPEPAEGFKALSGEKLWAVMWAAGYDLPEATKFIDPGLPGDDMHCATVTAGPFEGKIVCVIERAGPWAAVELGTNDAEPVDYFAAVRLCDLRFWRSVKGIDYRNGRRVTIPLDPPHVPPRFDAQGNAICPTPSAPAAPSGAGGGTPETHPCV